MPESITEKDPSLRNGVVHCPKCNKAKVVDSAECLRHGWPKCCGFTMSLVSTCPACATRGQTWTGDAPQCAFRQGDFIGDNWNCATMNELRDAAEGSATWSEDQYAAVIPADGRFVVLGWYKRRGRTEFAGILEGQEMLALTLKDAVEVLKHVQKR